MRLIGGRKQWCSMYIKHVLTHEVTCKAEASENVVRVVNIKERGNEKITSLGADKAYE